MQDFRNNHYVPKWYQKRFIPLTSRERKYYYLDLRPERVTRGGNTHTRAAVRRLGPASCFFETDLYTTQFGNWINTDIEKLFFGRVDTEGRAAVEYWTNFRHPSVKHEAFQEFIPYLSLQKLRTPKGLLQLSELAQVRDKNAVLIGMQKLRNLYGAVWAESVWTILDASQSPTKFILSDHPVTTYNRACFPGSAQCRGHRDPEVTLNASHTIFPLSLDKMLVLTNLPWARNPYGNPMTHRPNPALLRRSGLFNFMHVQTGRALSETEVMEINFVIKQLAFRYVAAGEFAWLFPEEYIRMPMWDKLGGGYLFMPDPRSIENTVETLLLYGGGRSEAFDPYGRQPAQHGYGKPASADDSDSLLAFQGEYARVFGPKRRGLTFQVGRTTRDEDSPEFHAYHLALEAKHKGRVRRWRR
ncbi:MAG: DUF4238 domain-containing protein [Gemmatimonadota bacterium]|nr:DUF4238 domain-containing protein [Gemmatimonadota bacterium]